MGTSIKPVYATLLVAMLLHSRAQGETIAYQRDVNVSFGQVSQFLLKGLEPSIDKYVRTTDCDRVAADDYRCGELPVGKIIDDGRKEILSVTLDERSETIGSIYYRFDKAKFPIYLRRSQTAGAIELPLLDSRKKQKVDVSPRLGSDVFLRLAPENHRLISDFCLAIPGFRGGSEREVVNGILKKETPWYAPNVRAEARVKIKPGSAEFASSRICSQLTTQMSNQCPEIAVKKLDIPDRFRVDHEGLKVDVHVSLDSFWSFVNNVTSLFGLDIERKIEVEIKKKVQAEASRKVDLTMDDVRSGRYLKKYVDDVKLDNVASRITEMAQDRWVKAGWGDSNIESALGAACIAAATEIDFTVSAKKQLLRFCMLAPKIKVEYFNESTEFRQKGCYSFYFDPRAAGQDPWWAEGCEIANRISVTIPEELAPIHDCMLEAWNARVSFAKACRAELMDFAAELEAGNLDQLARRFDNVVHRPPTDEEFATLQKVLAGRLGFHVREAHIHQLF